MLQKLTYVVTNENML